MAVAGSVLFAQSVTVPTGAAAPMVDTHGKPLAFDVVSVRENRNAQSGPPVYGPTPNGYHMVHLPIALVLIAAYAPTNGGAAGFFNPNDIAGMPDWVLQTRYDVDARVADSDLAAWQNPALQSGMMQAMLQQMLAERFKIVVHRENKTKPIYELRVGKNGPKLTESVTTDLNVIREKHPNAGALPGGMVIVEGEGGPGMTVYGATMASLSALMFKMVGRSIEDKTGLTGRYDISLRLDFSTPPGGERPDTESVVIAALQEQLGLKLEAAKGTVETLVIDHIERPTEN